LVLSTRPLGWVVSWLGLSGGACLLERLGGKHLASADDQQSMEGDSDVLR
jgi:hypothetical protein